MFNCHGTWDDHCNEVAHRAERTRQFLQRNFYSVPQSIKKQCYLSILRPKLEYASTVWDNNKKKVLEKLEKTQRRYARFIVHDWSRNRSVTNIMKERGLESLKERRKKARATMMYKIRHNLVDINFNDHFTRPKTSTSTRGHNEKLQIPFSRTNPRKNSFFIEEIKIWNSLPPSAIYSSNLHTFEKLLSNVQLSA